VPSQIHVSHGGPLIVAQDAADVQSALNAPSGRLVQLDREDGGNVLVNPDHVVYVEPWGYPEPMEAAVSRS
jgi:hypothetical protein